MLCSVTHESELTAVYKSWEKYIKRISKSWHEYFCKATTYKDINIGEPEDFEAELTILLAEKFDEAKQKKIIIEKQTIIGAFRIRIMNIVFPNYKQVNYIKFKQNDLNSIFNECGSAQIAAKEICKFLRKCCGQTNIKNDLTFSTLFDKVSEQFNFNNQIIEINKQLSKNVEIVNQLEDIKKQFQSKHVFSCPRDPESCNGSNITEETNKCYYDAITESTGIYQISTDHNTNNAEQTTFIDGDGNSDNPNSIIDMQSYHDYLRNNKSTNERESIYKVINVFQKQYKIEATIIKELYSKFETGQDLRKGNKKYDKTKATKDAGIKNNTVTKKEIVETAYNSLNICQPKVGHDIIFNRSIELFRDYYLLHISLKPLDESKYYEVTLSEMNNFDLLGKKIMQILISKKQTLNRNHLFEEEFISDIINQACDELKVSRINHADMKFYAARNIFGRILNSIIRGNL